LNSKKSQKKFALRTGPLQGVKLASMGASSMVPGRDVTMADFGSVGPKRRMIDSTSVSSVSMRNIPFDAVEERLVTLIKNQGRWFGSSHQNVDDC